MFHTRIRLNMYGRAPMTHWRTGMNIRTNLFVVLATVMLSLSSSMAWSQTLRSGIVLQPPRCDPAIAHCIIQQSHVIKTGNCRLVYKPAKKDGEEPSAETRCVLKGACAEIVSDVEPAPAGFPISRSATPDRPASPALLPDPAMLPPCADSDSATARPLPQPRARRRCAHSLCTSRICFSSPFSLALATKFD